MYYIETLTLCYSNQVRTRGGDQSLNDTIRVLWAPQPSVLCAKVEEVPQACERTAYTPNIEVCSMPTNRGHQVTMVTLEWTQKRAHSTSEVQLWPWPKKLTPAQSSASEVTVWDSLGIMMSVLSAKLHPTKHLGIEPRDAFLDSSTNTSRLIHTAFSKPFA